MSEILLLRHGETLWNAEGRIQGHRDSPLSPEGLVQAERLAARIAAEHPDLLYVSDLGRTRQTVAPIERATGLIARVDPALRERCYGVFEGRTWPEIEREFPTQYAEHQSGSALAKAEGGESLREFSDRAVGALTRIAMEAETGGYARVAIMSSGGVLGMLYRHTQGIPLEVPRNYAMPNASVNRFRYESGRWQLLAWGDVSHIDHALPDEFPDSVDVRFR